MPLILSKESSNTGILEYLISLSSLINSLNGVAISKLTTSVRGVIICFTSVLPNFTIPSKIFFSSSLSTLSTVKLSACSNSFAWIDSFLFSILLSIRFVLFTSI